MNQQFYILRHGEKTPDGSKLSNRGRKQAEHLAKRLSNIQFDRVYSSDLQRCKETAEILNNILKLPINYETALREIQGEARIKPSKYRKEIKVIKDFWNKLKKEKGTILIVSSGNVNRFLFSYILDIERKKANFMQNPTGLTVLEKKKTKGYRAHFINDTSHLPDKLRVSQD